MHYLLMRRMRIPVIDSDFIYIEVPFIDGDCFI